MLYSCAFDLSILLCSAPPFRRPTSKDSLPMLRLYMIRKVQLALLGKVCDATTLLRKNLHRMFKMLRNFVQRSLYSLKFGARRGKK